MSRDLSTFARRSAIRAGFAAALLALAASSTSACSGPGAARAMRQSARIGMAFMGLSLAIAVGGSVLLRARGRGRRARGIAAAMVLHPAWWMGTASGDCGFGLRYWSAAGTILIADVVLLAICWPGPSGVGMKRWRWIASGGLAGALFGLAIASLMLYGPVSMSAEDLALAGSIFAGLALAGALIGSEIFRLRAGTRPRSLLSLRMLLLLPVALAPLFVALLPVRPYEWSVSSSAPFRFVVVDDETGEPIPGATVQVLNPRFPRDDPENQYPPVVTGPDEGAESFLVASARGREGLLGRTETTTFHPQQVLCEAPGHRPFLAPLADDPSPTAGRSTDRPLGLTFPPPPVVTIRLRPAPVAPARSPSVPPARGRNSARAASSRDHPCGELTRAKYQSKMKWPIGARATIRTLGHYSPESG